MRALNYNYETGTYRKLYYVAKGLMRKPNIEHSWIEKDSVFTRKELIELGFSKESIERNFFEVFSYSSRPYFLRGTRFIESEKFFNLKNERLSDVRRNTFWTFS